MAPSAAEKKTAFPAEEIKSQKQWGTGLDSQLDPPAIFTKLEHFDSHTGEPSLHEYTGSG